MAQTELAIRLKADAAQVLAALQQVQTGFKGLQEDGKVTTTEIRALQGAMTEIGTAARQGHALARDALRGVATDSVAAVGAIEAAAARAGGALTATAGQVSAATSSMSAQFLDVGVMMASGQNPLILGIQQGTQIAQAFGQAGAAGAVGVFKAALSTVFSPFTLLTIAITAGVAALGQWAMGALGAEENTKDLAERLKELKDAQEASDKAAEAAAQTTEELTAKYGTQAAAVRELLAAEAELAEARANRARQDIGSGLIGNVTGGNTWYDLTFGDQEAARQFFELPQERNTGGRITELFAAARNMQTADGPDAQLAAANELLRVYLELANAVNGISDAEQEAARQLRNAIKEIIDARDAAMDAARDTVSSARAASRNGEGVSAEAKAETDAYREQANILALIAQYGEDSLEVANARTIAAREALIAELAMSEASEQSKEAMLASFDAANRLRIELVTAADAAEAVASSDIASGIANAIGPAAALAARLWEAARAKAAIGVQAGLTPATPGPAFERGGRSGDTLPPVMPTAPTLDDVIARYNPVRTSGAGGGGGSSRAEEIDAEAEATRKLREEQDRLAASYANTAANSISGDLADIATGAQTAGEAFRSLGDVIINTIARITAESITERFLTPTLNNLTGSFLGAIGGAFGGGAAAPAGGGFFAQIFGGLFATGAAPLSAMANTVASKPTAFDMGGGKTGILGEDGDEAILPLRGKGALAILPGGIEARLPLARGSSGDLGIMLPSAFATGGAPSLRMADVANSVPGLRAFPRSGMEGGAGGSGMMVGQPQVVVQMENHGTKAEVVSTRQEGNTTFIRVLTEQIKREVAADMMAGGVVGQAAQTAYGLRRQAR